MSKFSGLTGAQGALGAVAVAGAALAGAYYGGVFERGGAPVPQGIEVAQPVVTEAETESAEPRFDVVRVEPDGQSLIAGTAAPNSKVTVTLDGVDVAEVESGADGAFVAFAEVPASAAPQVLRLASGVGEGQGTVIVAPLKGGEVPEGEAGDVALPTDVVSETAGSQEGVALAQVETPEKPEAKAPQDTAAPAEAPENAAPVVILADDAGTRVIQQGGAPQAQSVGIDAITYDDAGDVALTGRAPAQGFVRVYLDNKPVVTQAVDQSGAWQADLPDVDSGVYTLRVDQIGVEGDVTGRFETPFKREAPETVTASPEALVKAVTVQPGATLWAIAKERYGSGLLYVQVFEANKARIRNPDLIYPGQVFDIPE